MRGIAVSAVRIDGGFAAFVGDGPGSGAIRNGLGCAIGVSDAGDTIQNVVLIAGAGATARIGFKGFSAESVEAEGTRDAAQGNTDGPAKAVVGGAFC